MEQKPSFLHSLIAGGVAGTVVDLLFFPIDTIKTRLQSAQGISAAGGFRGIYKGVGSVVVGSAPGGRLILYWLTGSFVYDDFGVAAAFFSTYDTMKKIVPFTGELAPVNHMISATIGEVVACLIRVPTEVVKTRTQTSSYGTAHASSLAAAKLVLQNDGLPGFYRGFGITIMREIPFTSLQFPLYEFLKLKLSQKLGRKSLYAHEAAMCGSIAGGVAALATTPLDVLKTRIMLDIRDSKAQQSPSLYTRLRTIYITEGARVLFSGAVPRTLWISAGGAVFLGAYEWTMHGLMGI